jgi:hypothetical protein
MPTKDEEILIVAIEEQRRVYDWVSANLRHTRNKTVTYLGAGLAILTFLYSHPNKYGATFIPPQTYGKVFYFAGLGLVLLALALLAIALKTVKWEFPTEDKDLKSLKHNSRLSYLKYVKERYRLCYKINTKYCEDKHALLNMAFPALLLGAIILAVLNLFGA